MNAPAAQGAEPRFVRELDTMIRARYPLVYLVTWEEQRLDAYIAGLATAHGKQLLAWSCTRGLRRLSGARGPTPGEETRDPHAALAFVQGLTEPAIVVLRDFHPHLSDPVVVRTLRELAHYLKNTHTSLLLVSPVLQLPPELEKEASVVDVPLPSYEELAQMLRGIIDVLRRTRSATIELTRSHADELIRAAMGLTLSEAENAFAKAIIADGKLSANDIQLIQDEKRQVIRKNGLLEFIPVDDRLESVGGLDLLKGWLSKRTQAFSEQARRFGLPEPKGILLLGVQGCGKSLTAKAVASHWRLPLLRLDMGRIFSGLVGSSEENLRRAIRTVESLAPTVLWIDEIEKGLAGAGGGGAGDSGVSARVFGTLLTWLQEKTDPVFVVATANKIQALPPELLRKGRFDEIFFVDLPALAERQEIFRIHLARRQRKPDDFDLPVLAGLTRRFSGAEIEQAIIEGLYEAYSEGSNLEQRHLESAIAQTVPLAVTMEAEIETLREWARTRTRRASQQTSVDEGGD